jgi:hypothetical protein
MKLVPEMTEIALGHTSGTIIDASNCFYSEPMLCPETIRHSSLQCVQGILNKNPTLLSSCPVVPSSETLPVVLKASPSQILISTGGEILDERCLGRPGSTPGSKSLPEGTHLITVKTNCTITSEKNWAYSLGSISQHHEIIVDEFLLKGIDVNLTLPEYPTLSPMDWNHIRNLSELTKVHLPALERLVETPYLTKHDNYVSWLVALVVVIALLAIVGFCLCRYRKSLRKCCCSKPSSNRSKILYRAQPSTVTLQELEAGEQRTVTPLVEHPNLPPSTMEEAVPPISKIPDPPPLPARPSAPPSKLSPVDIYPHLIFNTPSNTRKVISNRNLSALT